MTAAVDKPAGGVASKGLSFGAIGLTSTIVIAVASTAPGYSLASALGPVVQSAGVQAPIVMILAFVPMLFIAYAYKELNAVDPDCGTTFSWSAKAFGASAGWMGGWAIVAADVIVMANLAQVAGQYSFSLFGADGYAAESRGWVTVIGVAWIAIMTWICWRGIEVSAATQVVLLGIEIVMLVLFSIVALIKVTTNHGTASSIHPQWSWFNPLDISSFSALSTGLLTAVFIYWGWDTAVSINEETDDARRTPGRAAVLSTIILLLIYTLMSTSALAFAGTGEGDTGLGNPDNSDALSSIGADVFGHSGIGPTLSKLLILAILSSAAASTQTTILPTARTTLSMAVWKALPGRFSSMHTKYQTPDFSTWLMGGVSAVFYLVLSYIHNGNPLLDLISCIGLMIAFYYGMTGFACVWYFRNAMHTPKQVLTRGILPGLGGFMLLGLFIKASFAYYKPDFGYTSFHGVGGVFILGYLSLAIGFVLMLAWYAVSPSFFRRATTTLPRGKHSDDLPVAAEALVALGTIVLDQGAEAPVVETKP